ncbi:MAG TPA: oligosaccharide flippase family protein [Streptosporangiaceae bacterium]|nr:oligosaccharide flippase family protein [Streptosporangiaceae bacterium]
MPVMHPDRQPSSLTPEAGLVARGSVINVGAMTLGAVLGFGLTVLASRWLQPKQTGEFFELIALFTILSNSLALGADTGLTRWISRARAIGGIQEVRRIVLVSLVPVAAVGAAAAAAVWLSARVLAGIFLHGMNPAQAMSEFRLIAIFVPLGALSMCLIAGARGFGRMWPYLGIEGLGKPVLRIGLIVLALLAGWSLRGALLGWTIPVAIGAVASWLIVARLIRKEVPAAGRMLASAGRGRLAAGFWRFAAPRGLAGIFQVTVLWLDILLVGAILTSYDAGVYAAVSRLAMIGTFALEGTRLAIAPQLSGLLARRENSRAAALYQSATRLLMLASWPLYLMFAIFPTVVLRIFGAHYASGAISLVILSLAMLVNTGTGNVTVVLLMGGKSSLNVFNTVIALGINIGLNFLLLPRIGIAGAAIAWAASILVDNVLAAFEVWWVLDVAPLGRGYGLVVAVAGGCFGLVGLGVRKLAGQTLPALGLAVAIGLVAYVLVVYAGRGRLQLTGFYAAMRPRRQVVSSSAGAGRPGQARPGAGRHRAPAASRTKAVQQHQPAGATLVTGGQQAARGAQRAHPPGSRAVRRST